MHVLQALEHLVDDILLMDVFEDVSSNDGVKIRVHKVEDEVNVAIIFSSDDVLKSDNILVAGQFLQENDLTEGALGVSGILEGVEVFLERDDFLGALVDCLPDNSVGALSYTMTVNMQFKESAT